MSETPNIISKSTAWDFACRKRSHLQLLNAMNFSDTSLNTPALNIYHDDVQFFDPERNEIHLGTDGIVDMFKPEDELEFYNGMLYIQGHEEQHRRSTPNEAYARAINRGACNVIRYIANMEGDKKKAFRSQRQYEDYIIMELPKRGIYFKLDAIKQVMAYIANSLEDGRIERIRSSRLPGFAKLRVYFRGKFWKEMEKTEETWSEIKANPMKKMQLLSRELLSLATCQLYSIGFVTTYANTPILSDVNKMLPYIARAIMSGSIRELEPAVIGISNIFAPYIYEAFKMTKEEMEEENKAIADFLEDLIRAMIENSMDTNLGEFQEDTDEGGFESVFEHTDITVTLDDETFDKLMENKKEEKDSSGGGIMIKREHPKDDENDSEEDDSKSSGSDGGSESPKNAEKGSENGSSSGTDENEDGSSKPGKESVGSEKDDESKRSNGAGTPKPERGDEEESANVDQDDRENDSEENNRIKINPDKEWKSRKGKANRTGKSSKGSDADREKAIQSVFDAIRNAGKITRASAGDKVGRINERAGHAKKQPERITKDTAPSVTEQEMRDVLAGTGFSFTEQKRTYSVDCEMDPLVEARGKALHRKIEKYFRSLKTPNIRNLDSGGIDPSRIYGLAIGDTDVFRKPGKSKYFDGCAYILMDNSGSMWGQKFDEACKAAAIIEEGFRGIFPIKIVAFDDNYETVIHRVIKGWDESLRNNCSWNFHEHSHPGAGNADGCSIAVAAKELQRRPEKKKLLVVLSDGSPTEGGSDPVQLTKESIKNARKKGISVTGIYFEVGEVDPYGAAQVFHECYQKDYICCPLSELDKNLVTTFEKFARS